MCGCVGVAEGSCVGSQYILCNIRHFTQYCHCRTEEVVKVNVFVGKSW